MTERSRKVLFLSHCLLNQNVMPLGTEKYPGAVKELLDFFAEAEVGIIQMPSVEMHNGEFNSKIRTKEEYDSEDFRKYCRKISREVIIQICRYLKEDYKVLGILGVEFSPIYGVSKIEKRNRAVFGKGIFIEELENEMQRKNIQVPIIAVNINNILSTIQKLNLLLQNS